MRISDINNLADKKEIDSVSGKIAKVGDRTEKQGQYGKMISQKCIITDQTGAITLQFNGFDDMKYLEGKRVVITSSGTQYGLKGVRKSVWNDKFNKSHHSVVVTGTAKMEQLDAPKIAPSESDESQMEGMSTDFPPDEGRIEAVDTVKGPETPVNMPCLDDDMATRISILTSYACKLVGEMSQTGTPDVKLAIDTVITINKAMTDYVRNDGNR